MTSADRGSPVAAYQAPSPLQCKSTEAMSTGCTSVMGLALKPLIYFCAILTVQISGNGGAHVIFHSSFLK